jgi:uncharacterized coiled-coil DUF342 family protein
MAGRGSPEEVTEENTDLRVQVQAMEAKISKLKTSRAHYNDTAKRMAEQRDSVQAQYAEHRKKLDIKFEALKVIRKRIKVHKSRRNSLQSQLRELITRVKDRRASHKKGKSVTFQYNELGSDIARLENEIQTRGDLSLKKENKMLDRVRELFKTREELEPLIEETEVIKIDLSNIESAISEIKKQADIEHESMISAIEDAEKESEGLDDMLKERNFLQSEGDRLHAAFVEQKSNANEVHDKISTIIKEVTGLKNQIYAERKERKSWIDNHNASVRDEMQTASENNDIANSLVDQLLTEGKLTMGGILDSDAAATSRNSSSASKGKKKKKPIARASRGKTSK